MSSLKSGDLKKIRIFKKNPEIVNLDIIFIVNKTETIQKLEKLDLMFESIKDKLNFNFNMLNLYNLKLDI